MESPWGFPPAPAPPGTVRQGRCAAQLQTQVSLPIDHAVPFEATLGSLGMTLRGGFLSPVSPMPRGAYTHMSFRAPRRGVPLNPPKPPTNKVPR